MANPFIWCLGPSSMVHLNFDNSCRFGGSHICIIFFFFRGRLSKYIIKIRPYYCVPSYVTKVWVLVRVSSKKGHVVIMRGCPTVVLIFS
jgi:hypothetical protein